MDPANGSSNNKWHNFIYGRSKYLTADAKTLYRNMLLVMIVFVAIKLVVYFHVLQNIALWKIEYDMKHAHCNSFMINHYMDIYFAEIDRDVLISYMDIVEIPTQKELLISECAWNGRSDMVDVLKKIKDNNKGKDFKMYFLSTAAIVALEKDIVFNDTPMAFQGAFEQYMRYLKAIRARLDNNNEDEIEKMAKEVADNPELFKFKRGG